MGGRPGHAAHIVNDMGIMQECKYVEPALAGTAETYSPKVTIAGIRIWIGTAGYIAEDRYDIQRMLHNMSKEQATSQQGSLETKRRAWTQIMLAMSQTEKSVSISVSTLGSH